MRFRSHLLSIGLGVACLGLAGAQTDVLTVHNDRARTGQYLTEATLTPSNVNSTSFGKLFQATLDSVVDAQPLYVAGVAIPNQGTHNVLIVATENDSLYALDADSGAQLWKASLLATGEKPSDTRSCSQVEPQIGITSTPVIALKPGAGGAIFAVAMSKDSSGKYHQRLHKVSLTTGKDIATAAEITAKYPGSGEDSRGGYAYFDPAQYKERSGLLLLNGVVYLGWASHCDIQPYTGWIMGYSGTTLKQVSVIDVTPNGDEGAIWGAGAGMAADANGFIYFLDANGTFDTTLNGQGFPQHGDYGNAFVKLSAANNQLTVADYFTMSNTTAESNADEDLGSGGSIVLPDMTDSTGATRHLAIGAGKDGNIYLVDRDNMGKFNPNNDNAIYQEIDNALPNGIWSMPAYFNGKVYFGAQNAPIRAFQFTQARLAAAPVATTPTTFGYPGASPSVSANGTANGIMWAVQNNSTAVLHAYSADNIGVELYNSNQAGSRDHFGNGNKFMVPTIANGKVYVGTPNGVAAFGLLAAK